MPDGRLSKRLTCRFLRSGEKASGWAGSAEEETSPEDPEELGAEVRALYGDDASLITSIEAARFSSRRTARAKEMSFFMG